MLKTPHLVGEILNTKWYRNDKDY